MKAPIRWDEVDHHLDAAISEVNAALNTVDGDGMARHIDLLLAVLRKLETAKAKLGKEAINERAKTKY